MPDIVFILQREEANVFPVHTLGVYKTRDGAVKAARKDIHNIWELLRNDKPVGRDPYEMLVEDFGSNGSTANMIKQVVYPDRIFEETLYTWYIFTENLYD